MKYLLVLLLSTLAFGQMEIKQWRYQFKDDKLGMPLEQFRKQHTTSFGYTKAAPHCSDNTNTESALTRNLNPENEARQKLGLVECEIATTIADSRTKSAQYSFLDGVLYAIDIKFPHDTRASDLEVPRHTFDDAVNAVRQKYGPPGVVDVEQFQNVFGAHFAGRELAWQRAMDFIILNEYVGDRETSQVLIIDSVLLHKALARVPKKKPDF